MRLIDADALVKEICRDQCERKYEDCDGMCEMVAYVENAPTVGGWISVKDRLPELGELVLVAIYGTDVIKLTDGETLAEAVQRSLNSPGRVDVGFRDCDGWNDFCGPMIVTPSYWMPVPEPPKNNGEE